MEFMATQKRSNLQHIFAPRKPAEPAHRQRNSIAPEEGRLRAISFDNHGPFNVGNTLFQSLEFAQENPDKVVALDYEQPTDYQIQALAEEWDLHHLLEEDLIEKGQRAKAERHNDTLFVVARSVRYSDEDEDVAFTEIHMLVHKNMVAVLRQEIEDDDFTDTEAVAERHEFWNQQMLARDVTLVDHGPMGLIHAVLETIIDSYEPVIRGIEIDKEEIERQVFSGHGGVAERIYLLSREVIEVQQNASGVNHVLNRLMAGSDRYDEAEELKSYLQDLKDSMSLLTPRISELRDALTQILQVNGTLVSQRQNEDMKKISAWAAILFAPTLIGAIYGMNFEVMPELGWTYGYPMAIGAMVLLAAGLYVVFKWRNWM